MTARATWPALGTTASVVVTDRAALPAAASLLRDEIAAVDRACSRFRDDSELSRANAKAGCRVRVSPYFANALRVALGAAADTGGLVTPTLGAPLRAAGYDRTYRLVRVRDGFVVREAHHDPSSWRAVELDDEELTVRVPAGVELDLGATAKALAADRAAAAIAEATGAGVLVSLGGDIAVAGAQPAGGFPVAVAEDHADGRGGPVVSLAAGGLATSSTTVRRWRTDAGDAHHVIDPATGRPASTPWRTATVAARSCVEANVAATEALVAGRTAPERIAARALHARLVDTTGRVTRVGRWPE